VDKIIDGMEFAVGLVVGLIAIFLVARWLRFRYYRASKLEGDQLPADIRIGYVKDALKSFQLARKGGMSHQQALDAHAALIGITKDESLPLDKATLEAVGGEAVAMLMVAAQTAPLNSGAPTPYRRLGITSAPILCEPRIPLHEEVPL
jgi:hypothetical protein